MRGDVFVLDTAEEKAKFTSRLDRSALFDDLNRPLEVIVRRKDPHRSESQKGLFEVWVGFLSKATGMEHAPLREQIKAHLLEPVEVPSIVPGGESRLVIPSINDLTKEQMVKFMNDFQQFSRDFFGIELPAPKKRKK